MWVCCEATIASWMFTRDPCFLAKASICKASRVTPFTPHIFSICDQSFFSNSTKYLASQVARGLCWITICLLLGSVISRMGFYNNANKSSSVYSPFLESKRMRERCCFTPLKIFTYFVYKEKMKLSPIRGSLSIRFPTSEVKL